ncbi:MAG: site-2 protease family protein [Acidobacteriota bacterium]|nr:site-2 protease family protein [Acidobacteriota bacterium]
MYPPSGPGSPSSSAEDGDLAPYYVPPPLPPPRRDRVWLHYVLFLLTLVTTTLTGAENFLGFTLDFTQISQLLALPDVERLARMAPLVSTPWYYLNGLWYSVTVLAILGCHEMGHYYASLRYGVDVTRPFFIPAPPFFLAGTFGAFIRIRSRIPTKVALFDIGIAGPIAGFLVAAPALFIGLWMSRVVKLPDDPSPLNLIELGEPLLFQFAAWLTMGPLAEGYTISMHPVAFAAWFGLLATALNLFPISQLDGGHICYAVLGRKSTWVTYLMIAVAIGLTFVSLSWVAWTVLLVIMILILGPHHPPTLDEHEPLGPGRLILAGVALLMLLVCFTPAPIGAFVGR